MSGICGKAESRRGHELGAGPNHPDGPTRRFLPPHARPIRQTSAWSRVGELVRPLLFASRRPPGAPLEFYLKEKYQVVRLHAPRWFALADWRGASWSSKKPQGLLHARLLCRRAKTSGSWQPATGLGPFLAMLRSHEVLAALRARWWSCNGRTPASSTCLMARELAALIAAPPRALGCGVPVISGGAGGRRLCRVASRRPFADGSLGAGRAGFSARSGALAT